MSAVLITGGSRGIGAACVRRFAFAGWDVAINYCHSVCEAEKLVKECRGLGVRALAVGADVSCPDQARAMADRAEEELGGLDAAVCCAGIALPQQLFTDTTDEQWRRVMGVDLDGVFYTLRAVVPYMVRRKAGSIVTVSSMWGVTGGSCECAYSAAKAGVIGLTKALAKELGPSHIRVNCVAPGVVDTDMNRHLSPGDLEALAGEVPLGRTGTPEEIAGSVFFLASSQAGFITGQVLRADGGYVI